MIRSFLPEEENRDGRLAEAVNYSILAGGKRLRPILLREMYRKLGGRETVEEPFMAAIEMIHTASLIHDDLPDLDNDCYRRGRKTTWSVYGRTMGILSGDAMLNYAYETAFEAFSRTEDGQRVGRALQVLGEKSGLRGMLGGQSADVLNEGKTIEKEQLDYIYRKKTAALIEAPLMIGAILAGASGETEAQAELVGRGVGMAFQIRDDILDLTGTQEELGKPVGSDEKNQKKTYPALYGMEQARKAVEEYSAQALGILDQMPGENLFLRQLIEELITRKN